MAISERLKFLRQANGKTREEVANDLGIKVRALQTYETGERIPPTEMLATFAQYYNVSADYILEINNTESESNFKKISQSDEAVSKLLASFMALPENTKSDMLDWLGDACKVLKKRRTEKNKD